MTQASAKTFTVRGPRTDHLQLDASEWEAWLWGLAREGPITVHLSGCDLSRCNGCDGSEAGAPKTPRLKLIAPIG